MNRIRFWSIGHVCTGIAIALLTFSNPAVSDSNTPLDPPYLVDGSNHIIIGVVWDAAMLKKMLPSGITPVKELTGAYNIYHASRGYGVTPYNSVYAWVDVEGFDSADGTKGRWMLAGVYGPDPKTTAAFRDVLGLPVRNGTVVHEETVQGRRSTGQINGQPIVIAEVKSSAVPCSPVAGTLNYPVQMKGKILVNQIPYAGNWCAAEPVSLKVVAAAGDVFAKLVPAKVLWAGEFRNGTFALSAPTAKH